MKLSLRAFQYYEWNVTLPLNEKKGTLKEFYQLLGLPLWPESNSQSFWLHIVARSLDWVMHLAPPSPHLLFLCLIFLTRTQLQFCIFQQILFEYWSSFPPEYVRHSETLTKYHGIGKEGKMSSEWKKIILEIEKFISGMEKIISKKKKLSRKPNSFPLPSIPLHPNNALEALFVVRFLLGCSHAA